MDDVPVPEIVELSPPSGPRSGPRFGRWPLGQDGMRRARAVVTLAVFIGAAAFVLRWGPFDPTNGGRSAASPLEPGEAFASPDAIPDLLRHAWQRPSPVAPGPDTWGSGSLRITSAYVELRTDAAAPALTSSVAASGADSLVVTATADTLGCAAGDVGTYRVLLEGKGTVLTLTASAPDACPGREGMLTGPWVRADFPPQPAAGVALVPGQHRTTVFDPLSGLGSPMRLSYALPAGWEIAGEDASSVALHRLPDPSTGDAGPDPFIFVMTRPAVTVESKDGATCDPPPEARGVGHGLTDIVRAITTRPGVVSTRPKAVAIGGFAGTQLDLRVATSWTGGCISAEGRVVAIPLLEQQGSTHGPFMAISAGLPQRLILLDLEGGRTLAIVGASPRPAPFGELVAAVMPIIESFEFVPAAP